MQKDLKRLFVCTLQTNFYGILYNKGENQKKSRMSKILMGIHYGSIKILMGIHYRSINKTNPSDKSNVVNL